MSYTQVFLTSSLLAAAFVLTSVSAKCNTCNINGIACTNDNSFHICYNGQPDTTQIYKCPARHVCVGDRNEKCVLNAVAECAKQRNICGICDGSKPFTCLTRTTYAQCDGTYLLRSSSGRCPNGLTCDSSKPEICVVGGAECSK